MVGLMQISFFNFAVACVFCFGQGNADQDRWREADSATIRLSPAAYPRLPRRVRRDLRSRGCTIPQTFADTRPHNVISGEFARRGQTDWAVLCSRNGVSSILVFWGGSAKSVGEIARGADRNFLQVVGRNGEIGFSRSITTVGRGYILNHYRVYGGPKPPRIDHQGIDDGYLEKASYVLYYHRGKWLELQGTD
jgi:hypothetical protein